MDVTEATAVAQAKGGLVIRGQVGLREGGLAAFPFPELCNPSPQNLAVEHHPLANAPGFCGAGLRLGYSRKGAIRLRDAGGFCWEGAELEAWSGAWR